jgi:hypothetical protein
MKTFKLTSILAVVLLAFAFLMMPFSSDAESPPDVNFSINNKEKAPLGHEQVTFDVTTDKQGQQLWIKTFGNLDGYNLKEAKNITAITPIGVAPCSCSDPGATFKWNATAQKCESCGGGCPWPGHPSCPDNRAVAACF